MVGALFKFFKQLLISKADDNREKESLLNNDVETAYVSSMSSIHNCIEEPIDIYTQQEFTTVVSGDKVNHSIIIRDGAVKTLAPVVYIQGSLGLSDCKIVTLSPLRIIGSDVWCSFYNRKPILKTLGTLQRIEGNASFRYMPLEDLGELEYVGGNLSLRDTSVNSLGKLNYVGGNLYLPKRLENKVELNGVYVGGKIRYWNDIKVARTYCSKYNEDDFLVKSKIPIPAWPHTYIYPTYDISQEPKEVHNFYEYFKSLFFKGVLLDVEGYSNYYFFLVFDLQRLISDPNELAKKYHILSLGYPKVKSYCDDILLELYTSNQMFDKAWNIEKNNPSLSLKTVGFYMGKIGGYILTAPIAAKICGVGCLTSLGLSHQEDITPFFMRCLQEFEEERGCKLYDLFFDKDQEYKSINGRYDSGYYKQFFYQEECFAFYDAIDRDDYHLKHRDSFLVVENAIKCQLRVLLIKAETAYRESIGLPLPQKGEGWVSETNLFYQIRNHFKDYEVIQHGRPQWLGRQHLDIYFPNENIGIEYQGIQHYQPVDYFGGEEGFAKNQERDERKRKLCKKHSCYLIYVDEGYDIQDIIEDIDKVLKQRA